MPLAAFEKTWQFDVNRVIAASGTVLTTSRNLWRELLVRLTSFATLPWTVQYSCDSVTAGTPGDGVDHWAANANLVWVTGDTGTARSWKVLRNVDGLELLFELRNPISTNGKGMRVVCSHAAHFTGGTTTQRPTATDEIVLTDGASTEGAIGLGSLSNSTDRAYAYHVLHSTDGLVTMVVICFGGEAVGFWYFGRLSQPVSGFTFPVVAAVWGDAATTPAEGPHISQILEGQNSSVACTKAGMRHGSTNARFFGVCEGFGSGSVNSAEPAIRNILVANEISNEWQLPQVGVGCSVSGLRGLHGRLFDVSWISTARATGDRMPTAAPFTHVVVGDLVIPWNNTVMIAA